MKRFRVLISVLVAAALFAGACGDSSESDTAPGQTGTPGTGAAPTTSLQPVTGGKLAVLITSETRGMDPIAVTGSSGLGGEPPRMYAVYDALMLTDNKTGEVKPALAESLTTTDRIVWTLKLRPNVKFSDGTAYDAEAVKFNWDRHNDPANNSTARGLIQTMKSIEVVDSLTIRVTLNAENGQFPRNVASNLAWSVSPTAAKAKGKDYGNTPANIVGAGPFIVKEWTRDSRMVLTKNPNYWQPGKPYLDELEFRVLSDEQQRMNSLTTGEADLAWLNTLPVQKLARDQGLVTQQVNGVGASGLNFNLTKEPFNDASVRKAVQLAVDSVQLNQVATDGLGEPITSWFPTTTPWYDAAVLFPKFNAAEAQKLIDAYVAEKGKNLEFTLTTSDAGANPKIAEFIAAALNKLQKVSVKTAFKPGAQTTADLRAKNYDMIPYAYLGADPEPQFYDSWHSKGTRNFSGYSNPAVDAALVRARNATETAARKVEYTAVQKALIDDGIPMLLTSRTVTALTTKKDRVQGIEMWEDGGGVFFDKIWIQK
ncbi:MAG TPA: ABC transporter substrate-binding protein [Acidimicrobiales bacterium]|nr:ABC transporter substrate-binding protein [Acidimicrobiales bacterium]